MRIRELDGLRAIAALAVIALHYCWGQFRASHYGWLGVDLFFVLSGFLITSILLELKDKPNYFKTFYARRSMRVFPPYFFVLAIYMAACAAHHDPTGFSFWAKYLFFYRSLLFLESEPVRAVCRVGLLVLWSLSVEELFYTFWAPAVRFLNGKRFTWLLATMIFTAPLVRLALHSHTPYDMYFFFCRMDGLALGALVAVIARNRRTSIALRATDTIFDGVCYFTGALFVVYFAVAGADYHRAAVSVLGISIADVAFASLVYYIVRHPEGSHPFLRLLRWRPLRSIGTVSYALYLVHFPLLVVASILIGHLHLSKAGVELWTPVTGFALSLLASYAMWYGFESYAMRLKDHLFPSPATTRAITDEEPTRRRTAAQVRSDSADVGPPTLATAEPEAAEGI